MNEYKKVVAMVVSSLSVLAQSLSAGSVPIGTAFTYQGLIKQSGANVDGAADFQFSLWDAASGSKQIGPTVSVDNVSVADGLFAVDLDFGPGVFNAQARWLEIAVRSPAGSGTYIVLSPRQSVHPAPMAQFALEVDGANVTNLNASNISTGTLPSAALSGDYGGAVNFANPANVFGGLFNGSGAGLNNLNASNVSSGTLAIGRGGTGATTAMAALTSLNAQARVTGVAAPGNYIRGINADGTVLTGVDADSGGDITAVTAGLGLSGGGTIGSVTLSVGNDAITNAMLTSDSTSLNKVSGGSMTALSGNVGIGNSTPALRLSIVDNGVGIDRPVSNSLGLYTANFERIRIRSDGNVGIGTTVPTSKLQVAGDARVQGSLLVEGTVTIPPTQRVLSLSPAAFVPSRNNFNYQSNFSDTRGTTAGQAVEFAASLNLPTGANVTGVTVYVQDNDATQNMTVSLLSRDHTNFVGTLLGNVTTSGSSTTIQALNLANSLSINNSNTTYTLQAEWITPTSVHNCRVLGARVTYTVTAPLP